ncbi:MAG: DUF1887 family protein [Mogibacterium sp.]|nr:DUF1887 family protein [Mogibacterium sp.]
MLLIDFFEKTPISSLVPVNSIRPDRVVYLIDSSHLESLEARHMRKAVEGLGCVREFAYRPVDIKNVNSIRECLMGIIGRSREGEEVYIDLTGGSELMVAAGYSITRETKAHSVYADMDRCEIVLVEDLSVLCSVNHITSRDYLTSIGAKRLRDSHSEPTEEEREHVFAIAEILFQRTGDWHALSEAIAKAVQGTDRMEFSLPEKLFTGEGGQSEQTMDPADLLNAFTEHGFLRRTGENRYAFTKSKYREYMTVYGIWLEMYVYLKGKELFDEAYIGIVLDWNTDDANDSEDNEVDVVFLRNSIPYFISCKMRRIEAADIYEIGFVAHHFGGNYAKRFIATSHPLNGNKPGQRSLLAKLRNMNVGLLVAEDIKEQGIEALIE